MTTRFPSDAGVPRWPWPADDPRRFRRVLTARDFPLLRDGDGRPLCRWCGEPVKSPRRTLCSDGCEHEINLRTSTSYLARQVYQRDGGVCALCAADTMRGRRLIYRYRSQAVKRLRLDGTSYALAVRIDRAVERILRERLALPAYGDGVAPWQADHITPVSEGGGGCGLDGMRTLCLPCHGKETGALRRRLNAGRNHQLQILDTPGRERVDLPAVPGPGSF